MLVGERRRSYWSPEATTSRRRAGEVVAKIGGDEADEICALVLSLVRQIRAEHLAGRVRYSGAMHHAPLVELLEVACWCGDRIVLVERPALLAGSTSSCGAQRCAPPARRPLEVVRSA